jgi:SAM-dependent methyltransferase
VPPVLPAAQQPEFVALDCCPACGSPGGPESGRRGALELHVCSACALVYSDPQPRGIVARRYLEEYDLAAHFHALGRRKKVLFESRLTELPPPRPGREALCDVGCGDGQFLEMARSAGWSGTGIELNPPAAARTRERGFKVLEGRFEELSTDAWGTFDVVTSWDSLEHTVDPAEFAARLARLLRPGGTLALTTLNMPSLAGRVFGTRWSMVAPDHFTYWNEQSLRGLLVRSGLSPRAVHSFGVGRDFFAPLDRVADRFGRRGTDPTGMTPAAAGAPAGARWDVLRPVLWAERGVNRFLDRTRTGVGIAIVAVKE